VNFKEGNLIGLKPPKGLTASATVSGRSGVDRRGLAGKRELDSQQAHPLVPALDEQSALPSLPTSPKHNEGSHPRALFQQPGIEKCKTCSVYSIDLSCPYGAVKLSNIALKPLNGAAFPLRIALQPIPRMSSFAILDGRLSRKISAHSNLGKAPQGMALGRVVCSVCKSFRAFSLLI